MNGLKLEPIEPALTDDGWSPLLFQRVTVRAKQSASLQAVETGGLEGPYLFVFDDPKDIDVLDIVIGGACVPHGFGRMPATALIKATEGAALGDRFFAVIGPSLQPGYQVNVSIENTSSRERSVALTVFGRPQGTVAAAAKAKKPKAAKNGEAEPAEPISPVFTQSAG